VKPGWRLLPEKYVPEKLPQKQKTPQLYDA
jgi:hypothetical protein